MSKFATREDRERAVMDALERAEGKRDADVAAVLREHWLTSVECDHEAGTDVATCFCAVWRSEPQPTVRHAVERWIEHVVQSLTKGHA